MRLRSLLRLSLPLLVAQPLIQGQPPQPIGTFTFGFYAGECVGQCVVLYRLDLRTGRLTENRHAMAGNFQAGYYQPRGAQDARRAWRLWRQLPPQLLASPSTTFGEPDARDQGGYYLALQQPATTRRWLLDDDHAQTPPFLHAFTDSLVACVDKLRASQAAQP